MKDVLVIKVGLDMAKFLDPKKGSSFISEIQDLRNEIFEKTGKTLPKIRIQDRKEILDGHYCICVNGAEITDKKAEDDKVADEIMKELKLVIKNCSNEIFK